MKIVSLHARQGFWFGFGCIGLSNRRAIKYTLAFAHKNTHKRMHQDHYRFSIKLKQEISFSKHKYLLTGVTHTSYIGCEQVKTSRWETKWNCLLLVDRNIQNHGSPRLMLNTKFCRAHGVIFFSLTETQSRPWNSLNKWPELSTNCV